MELSTTSYARGLDEALPRAALELASDERLVALTRRGFDPAFEAIVRRHQPSLLRYSGRFLEPERAEDAVQQSFMKALAAMRADDRPIRLKPWLFRIVHNESLNAALRNGSRHEQLDENFDGVAQPPDVVDRSERLREVVSEISSLPARQRSAVVLREFEGRSYDEIAAALGVTTPIVRQLLHRARTRLRATCGALLPLDAIRAWFEAVSSPSGAAMAKLGTAAVLTGAIAGGAAIGVPGERNAHDRTGPTAAAAPAESGARGTSNASQAPVTRGGGILPVTPPAHALTTPAPARQALAPKRVAPGAQEHPAAGKTPHERPRPDGHHGSDAGDTQGEDVQVAGGESGPSTQDGTQSPQSGQDSSGSGDGSSPDPSSGAGSPEGEASTPGVDSGN